MRRAPQNRYPGQAPSLTLGQKENIVRFVFLSREIVMIRAVVEEAAALAAVALFVGTIAVWVHVFAAL
jgi:hypothetical protein